jgi:hypothetical protein
MEFAAMVRQARDNAVLQTMQTKITQPWWGTATELVALLDLQTVPPLTARGLSDVLRRLEETSDWTVVRWRMSHGRSRMLALLPPGWVWDGENRRWVVHGVPQAPYPSPSQP